MVLNEKKFAKYKIGNTPIKRLHTGMLWAEGPAWTGVGKYLMWSDIPTDDVYLSIDKDVFSPALVRTDLDQGDFTLDSVAPFLHSLTDSHHVCGADICRERPADPLESLRHYVHHPIPPNQPPNQRLLDPLPSAG